MFCFGDGGAVVTNDDEIAEYIRTLRDHGRDSKGEVITWGHNARLDNIQAAILNYKLKSYDEKINKNLKGKYVGLEILGPAPCFLEKLKNQFRYQLVFKSKKSS